MSSLLSSAPEARKFIEAGEMIADHIVGDLLLEALLLPVSDGLSATDLNTVVDGFPRTAVQVCKQAALLVSVLADVSPSSEGQLLHSGA